MDQQTPRQPRLRRSNDRQIAGVAGGVADYFGIDPVIARLGFVVALFAGGAGLIAYLIGWVVLPEASDAESPTSNRPLDRKTTIVVLALAVALWIAVSDPFDAGVIVPLILLGVGGYLLYQRPVHPDNATSDVKPPATSDRPISTADAVAVDSAPQRPVDLAPPTPRQPAVVTRGCLSALSLLFAGAIMTRQLNWIQADTSEVIAVGLVLVGIAAIVGSFIGRSRGLVLIGVFLSLAFATASVIEPVVEDGIGERLFRPTSIEGETPSYNLGIGDLVVDLRELDIEDGSQVTVKVKMGIGHVVVYVPTDVDVMVTGDLDVGELIILDEFESGLRNKLAVERDVDGDALLTVELEMGIGQAEVLGE